MTREVGKVAAEAAEEADGAVGKDALIDAIVEANQPQVVGGAGEAQSLIVRSALGVVVVLAPWNFPADEILLLAIPALIAGNTVRAMLLQALIYWHLHEYMKKNNRPIPLLINFSFNYAHIVCSENLGLTRESSNRFVRWSSSLRRWRP